MKSLKSIFCTLGLAGLGLITVSFIPPTAPSASHAMENAAVAIHEYLHTAGYSSSYGAHGLDVSSTALHEDLHGWQNGTVSEAQIAADFAAVEEAYKTFNVMIHTGNVLGQGDDMLDALFLDTKDAYKTLRHELNQVKG